MRFLNYKNAIGKSVKVENWLLFQKVSCDYSHPNFFLPTFSRPQVYLNKILAPSKLHEIFAPKKAFLCYLRTDADVNSFIMQIVMQALYSVLIRNISTSLPNWASILLLSFQ